MEDNKAYLEGMAENFEISLATGNYVECKEIIKTLRDEGFEAEAKQAHTALMEESIGTFLVESDPRNLK